MMIRTAFTVVVFFSAFGVTYAAGSNSGKSSVYYKIAGGKTFEVTENVSFSTLDGEQETKTEKLRTRLVLRKTIHSELEILNARANEEKPSTKIEVQIFRVSGKPREAFERPLMVIKSDASDAAFVQYSAVPLVVTESAACCASTKALHAFNALNGKLVGSFDESYFFEVKGLVGSDARYISFASSSAVASRLKSEEGDLGILTYAGQDGVIQTISLRAKQTFGWGMAPKAKISFDARPEIRIKNYQPPFLQQLTPDERAPGGVETKQDHVLVSLNVSDVGRITIPIEGDRLAVNKAIIPTGVTITP